MNEQDDILRISLDILKRRYLHFILLFAVLFGASVAVAVWLPPIYRSEARILVESQQIPRDLVRSTVTALAEERIQVIRQRITTRNTILNLARKFDLFPEQRAKLSTSGLVELIRERIDISIYDIGGQRRRQNRRDAFTIAFRVGFEYEKPHVAASVAGELVTLILNEDVKSRTSRASDTTKFLEREHGRLQRQLVVIEREVAVFKTRNKGALPSQLPLYVNALEKAKLQDIAFANDIRTADDQIRLLNFELQVRKSAATSGDGQGAAVGSSVNLTEQRLNVLKAQLAERSLIYSDQHPDIKTLKAQIAALENQHKKIASIEILPDEEISDEEAEKMDVPSRLVLERINSAKSRKKLLVDQKAKNEKEMAELQAKMDRIPEVENGLAVLERRHTATQKSLTEISEKLAQARLGERLEADQQAERLQVLEQPVTPQQPIKPDRKKIMAMGFAISGAIAGGLVFGLELLDQSIRSSADLMSKLGRRPLVVIPYINTRNERRKRFLKRFFLFILLLVVAVAVVLGVHLYFMPLEVLIPKVMKRLSL